jgi:competence protein ComEC
MAAYSFLATCSLAFFLIGIWYGTLSSVGFWLSPWALWIWLTFLVGSRLPYRTLALSSIIASLPLGFWAGWSHVHLWRTQHTDSFTEQAQFEGEVLVVDAPDVRADRTFLTVHPLDSPAIHQNILLKTDRYPLYHYGDYLWASGRLEHPLALTGFDYPLFLQRAKITAIISRPHIHPSTRGPTKDSKWFLFLLRESVEHHIARWIPEPESSFLNGILLGSKRAIPDDIQAELKVTGTTHIIAISGANITILLTLLVNILPLYSARVKFFVSAGIASFIATLTGGSASVMRGASVAFLGTGLRWQERRIHALGLMLVPAAIMLIPNPLLLRADPGFQLSFAAYGGLLFLGKLCARLVSSLPLLKSLPQTVQSALAETTAASIGTAPISWISFGVIAPLGLIVNPTILWLLPAITFLGLLLVSVGWLPFFASLIALPLWVLLHTVLQVIHRFSLLTSP